MKTLFKILLSIWILISFLNVSAATTNSWASNSWTLTQPQVDQFKLNWVNVIYDNELLLNFNHELYSQTWVPIEININDKENSLNTINIDTNTVSWSTLDVKLKTPLLTNHKYEVVVIQLFDINLSTIWQWVNASSVFTTPATFDIRPTISDTNSWSSNSWTNIDLNSAADVNLNSIFKDVIPTEKTKPTESTTNNTANTFNTAKNSKKLPTTWPAEWLLLAIALFFSLVYFTFKTRRRI